MLPLLDTPLPHPTLPRVPPETKGWGGPHLRRATRPLFRLQPRHENPIPAAAPRRRQSSHGDSSASRGRSTRNTPGLHEQHCNTNTHRFESNDKPRLASVHDSESPDDYETSQRFQRPPESRREVRVRLAPTPTPLQIHRGFTRVAASLVSRLRLPRLVDCVTPSIRSIHADRHLTPRDSERTPSICSGSSDSTDHRPSVRLEPRALDWRSERPSFVFQSKRAPRRTGTTEQSHTSP